MFWARKLRNEEEKSYLLDEIKYLTSENMRLKAELKGNELLKKEMDEYKQQKTCDNRVLCQNCVHGIVQKVPIVLSNGERQEGHVFCKLNSNKNICENFSQL